MKEMREMEGRECRHSRTACFRTDFYGSGNGQAELAVPGAAQTARTLSPTHRPGHARVQVLFTPCVVAGCAHFFIFLFFLCLLRMRFLAHLSLILVSND